MWKPEKFFIDFVWWVPFWPFTDGLLLPQYFCLPINPLTRIFITNSCSVCLAYPIRVWRSQVYTSSYPIFAQSDHLNYFKLFNNMHTSPIYHYPDFFKFFIHSVQSALKPFLFVLYNVSQISSPCISTVPFANTTVINGFNSATVS